MEFVGKSGADNSLASANRIDTCRDLEMELLLKEGAQEMLGGHGHPAVGPQAPQPLLRPQE